MAIEFQCSACQTRIRTPDDSAGKMARCSKCGATTVIPATSASSAQQPLPSGFSPQPLPSGFDPYAMRPPPSAAPPGKPPANPFADAQFNPYAAPAGTPLLVGPSSLRDQARTRLLGPAIGLLVTTFIGAGFLGLAIIGLSLDRGAVQVPNDPAEQVGFYGAIVGIFLGGFVVHVLQLLAAVSMLRVRGRSLAVVGTYASFFPCNCYCFVLGIPFAIWGAIVLANPQVRSAFDQP